MPPDPCPDIIGSLGQTIVRVLDVGDAAPLYRAAVASRAHVGPWMPAVAGLGDEQAARRFIERVQSNVRSNGRFWAGIWHGQEYAGSIGLTDLDDEHRTAEWGIWLTPAHTRRGIARTAATILIDFLFGQYRLHRIAARFAVENRPSAAMLERLGFTREGRLREAEFLNGVPRDVYLFGLLQHEWRLPGLNSGND